MLKWIKWLFSKKVKVVVNNNYTEDLHSIRKNKAVVGKPMTIVIKANDGFVVDFVRVYRKKVADSNEIECTTTINNIVIIKYTPQKEDEKIIVQASARMIGPGDYVEVPTSYEIRCDEYQYEIPRHGGDVYIRPYVIKTESSPEGRIETIIHYNPQDFQIEIFCEQMDNGDWVLEGNRLIACHNKTAHRIIAEMKIHYNNRYDVNQIYQE